MHKRKVDISHIRIKKALTLVLLHILNVLLLTYM